MANFTPAEEEPMGNFRDFGVGADSAQGSNSFPVTP